VQGDARPADAELDELLPAVGAVFDGRFAIERLLGRGGMGCVLLARHLELEQQVALKLLRPDHRDGARGAQRLLREARASARIKSEHVVRVLDVVSRQKAAPYIVMEYLEGEDLARHLAEHGPLSVRDAATIVAQACEAVGEGHRLGIVHRDLKPSNLFLCARTSPKYFVKVLDFGISKSEDESTELLTHSHALLGSPVYAAPEQLQSSHSVDARADIWSLGVLLYECVTGQRPFAGGSLAQVCTQILQEPPTPFERHGADVPAEFRALVWRCLEKNRADRFGSIEQLLIALTVFSPQAAHHSRSYLDGLAASPRTSSIVAVSMSNSLTGTLTGSAEYDTRAARVHRRARFRVGATFWLAVLAISLLSWWAYSRVSVSWNGGGHAASAAPTAIGPASLVRTVAPDASTPRDSPVEITTPAVTPLPASSDAARLATSARSVPQRPRPAPPRSSPSAVRASTPWVESR
jgi:eukaryotic-like serine/threonine-protein kinase